MKKNRMPQIPQSIAIAKIRAIRIIRGFLFLLLPLFTIQTSYGQTVKGEIVAGFGGYYRIGKCMPIKITLENLGADLAGILSIHISHTEFVQSIALPVPSKKTYAFYLTPPKYFQELEVKLFSEGKLLRIFSSPVHHLADDERLILKSSALQSPSTETILSKEKTAYLDPREFPESWSDYEAVDSIILDASDIIRLNMTQRTALSRWTLLGGSVTLYDRNQASSVQSALGLGSFGAIKREGTEETPYQPSLFDLDEEVFKALRIREPVSHRETILAFGIFLLFYGLVIIVCLAMARKTKSIKIWIYVAIPTAVILFSVCSPWAGLLVNAENTPARQYSIHHVFINSMDEFATYDISLIFPRKGEGRLRPAISSPYLVHNEVEKSTDPIHYEFEGKRIPSVVFNMKMGSKKLISLSGFSSQSPFSGLRTMDSVALMNKSESALYDCTLVRNGISIPAGHIPPGKGIHLKSNLAISDLKASSEYKISSKILAKTISVYETETLAGSTGDCVICATEYTIPSLESNDLTLAYAGSTAVIYHLGKHRDEEQDLVQK
jgi:hypothetical protein